MKFFLSIFSLVLMATYTLAAEEASAKVVSPKAAVGNNGYGNSYGNGYGNSYGNGGYGFGNSGFGNGYGNSYGNSGYGSGYGNSYGNSGYGNGYGNSYGNNGWGNNQGLGVGSFGGVGLGKGSCRTLDAMVFARNRAIQPLQQARQTCHSVNNLERVIDTLDIMINSLASQNKGCSYALNNDNRHFYSKK